MLEPLHVRLQSTTSNMTNSYHGRTSIAELTEVDIMTDSVIDICDKLFARCTEGKTIDYATDSPMPNTVNPLSVSEAVEWRSTAMQVKLTRVSGNPRRRGKVVISKAVRSTQRTSAAPFFGYVSEPPTADGFRADQPIGPAAKALKAAGILTAIAKNQGKPTTAYVNIFTSTWGPVTEETMSFVTPDLTNSSGKDIIKFVRSSNHCLFGFNSNAPAVTVDMGRYRPETMINNYQFDWHAISLTMRFIGEFISKYNVRRLPVDTILYMAPAYEEGKIYKMSDLTVPLIDLKAKTPCAEVLRIAENTMKYYAASMATYGVASMMRSVGKNISIMADTEATAAMVRSMQARLVVRHVRLPKDVGKTMSKGIIGEVHSASRPSFRKLLAAAVNDRKLSYLPTWRSIHTFVWASAFKSTFPRDEILRSMLRKKSLMPTYGEDAQREVMVQIAKSIPKGLGHSIVTMLISMLPDKDRAITEFATMIMTLSGRQEFTLDNSYESMYTQAVATSRSVEDVFQAIQAGYTRAEQDTHSASSFMSHLSSAGDIHSSIILAIESFMRDRLAHWSRHYASRMIDNQAMLKSMKFAVRAREIKTGLKSSLGKTLALDHATSDKIDVYMIMGANELLSAIETAKADAVMYAFLSTGYKHATVRVTHDLDVKVELQSGDLREILKRSTSNYARKRKTWSEDLRMAAYKWDEDILKLDLFTRCADMLNHCDRCLDPIVKWTWMYTKLLLRYEMTAKAVSTMIKKHVFPDLLATVDFDREEVEAAKESSPLSTSVEEASFSRTYSNPYDVLDVDSSDDESKIDAVLERTTPTTATVIINVSDTLGTDPAGEDDFTLVKSKNTTAKLDLASEARMTSSASCQTGVETKPAARPSRVSLFDRLRSSSLPQGVTTVAKTNAIGNEALYSLRVAIEASDIYRFDNRAFRAYLDSINVMSDDYKIPFASINDQLLKYNEHSKTTFMEADAAMAAILRTDMTDIG